MGSICSTTQPPRLRNFRKIVTRDMEGEEADLQGRKISIIVVETSPTIRAEVAQLCQLLEPLCLDYFDVVAGQSVYIRHQNHRTFLKACGCNMRGLGKASMLQARQFRGCRHVSRYMVGCTDVTKASPFGACGSLFTTFLFWDT